MIPDWQISVSIMYQLYLHPGGMRVSFSIVPKLLHYGSKYRLFGG